MLEQISLPANVTIVRKNVINGAQCYFALYSNESSGGVLLLPLPQASLSSSTLLITSILGGKVPESQTSAFLCRGNELERFCLLPSLSWHSLELTGEFALQGKQEKALPVPVTWPGGRGHSCFFVS